MARIRQVKPQFFSDGLINELKPAVRLFYIGLWTFADDDGLLEDKPADLRRQIMPDDRAFDAAEAIECLVGSGRLARYVTGDGTRILHIVKFHDHQVIGRPSQAKLLGKLGYERGETIREWKPIPGALNEHSMSPRESQLISTAVEGQVGVEQIPCSNEHSSSSDEPNPDASPLKSELINRQIDEVLEHWKRVFGKDRARIHGPAAKKRRDRVRARLLEGWSPSELMSAISGFSRSSFHVQGGYVDVPTVLRDGQQVEKGIELDGAVKPATADAQGRTFTSAFSDADLAALDRDDLEAMGGVDDAA